MELQANRQTIREAKKAGLEYSSDDVPGIERRGKPDEFTYWAPNGKQVRDEATLARIRSLAIPPAYKQVWICQEENGHLQATGRDARNRKQYRYHLSWREHRDANKFQHVLAFAQALKGIRKQVADDLESRGLTRNKVLAALVRLLETTLIRIGNDEYARANHSYGLTTMRNRHAKVLGKKVVFDFVGKSGKHHHIDILDQKLARIVQSCQDLPGQHLFEYKDLEGHIRAVKSQDVNNYLREISGENYTAKDFRTWIATVLAAIALREFDKVTSPSQAKRNVKTVFTSVAKVLGNTPAICRKCYVHPEIVQSYLDGSLLDEIEHEIDQNLQLSERIPSSEAAVLVLLERRLKIAKKGKSRRRVKTLSS
jgi:DNA topoisomerase-1